MAWVPGQSGNPEGARIKARRFSNLLDRALKQEESKAEEDHRLRMAIEKQMTKASEGDLNSLQFLADRIDGKPAQAVTLSGDPDAPLVTRIERVVVNPSDGNAG